MKYLSVKEMAKLWNVSERTIRNYCQHNKIPGAFLTGKTWNIPEDASLSSKNKATDNKLLNILQEEKNMGLKGGIYHKTQVLLTYNSNHIEGSKLSEEETNLIFETNTISGTSLNVDDIIETQNHFKCFNYIIDNAKKELNEEIIKKIHCILKINTSDSFKDWFNVGEYKKLPNEVGGSSTTLPLNVKSEIKELLNEYKNIKNKDINNIIWFHQRFETIHPFQDGNGRVGRLIMFKECLHYNIIPFIITDDLKLFYYRGLKEWDNEKGYLIDTCLTAQDRYKKYLDYFNIAY